MVSYSPRQMPAEPNDQTRAEIIRSISGAINGSMKEMGFFPGMQRVLDQARKEIANLREQHMKLISDNTTLTRITSQQKTQIKLMLEARENGNGNANNQVLGLQNEVHQLRADREALLRHHQQ